MIRARRLLPALLLLPLPARAQSLGLDPGHDLPVWMRSWSALGARADLTRRLPGAGSALSSLLYGAPRVGSFWTAGNPAGLVDGVRDTRSDVAGAWSKQSGEYKRPLDPGGARLLQATAQSWKGFSPAFSMLGRVTFDQERLDPGSRADFIEAFPSSPFVSTDTSASSLRRTRAALEGVAGWRLGRWGLGVTVGYEGRDHISIVSTVIRRTRSVRPGVVLGVSRKFGGMEIGGFGRVRRTAETFRIFERGGSGRVYELTGYREVPFISLVTSYYKRREENVSSFGGTLAGRTGGLAWTLYAEGDQLAERLTRQETNNPAQDEWRETGWSAGGALQRPLGSTWLVTVHGRALRLTGKGDLALDSAGTTFRAEERSVKGEAELRLLPRERSWTGTLTFGLTHQSRVRRDSMLQLGTDVSNTSASVALELGRPLGDRFFAGMGLALAFYGPTSALPDPASRGPVYQFYIAPEYALYASRAHPTAFSLLLRYRVSSKAELWLSGRTERLASSETTPVSPFTPGGSRTATSAAAGVTF